MNQPIDFIFQIAILIFSVVIHEVSHGLAAYRLGDPTAKDAGRLTLNPLPHLDLIGSVIVPLMTYFLLGGRIFGWAKPVPFNPYYLRNPKRDSALIALAGPASNLFVAAVFGILIRLIAFSPASSSFVMSFVNISAMIIFINVLLAVFNLVPIPPLDGSKILFGLLPSSASVVRLQGFLEQYGFIILIVSMSYLFVLISPAIFALFRLFSGLSQ